MKLEHDEWLESIASQLDDNEVSELIGDEDHTWLCDAAAYAHRTGDWLFVKTQWEKHAIPLIKKEAEHRALVLEARDERDAGTYYDLAHLDQERDAA